VRHASSVSELPGASLGSEVWRAPALEVARAFQTSPETGLEVAEAARRLERFGPNQLRTVRGRSSWRILSDQFASLIVALLSVAAVVAFTFDETIEAFAIIGVIFLNALIGFTTERRAVRSMEALRKLGQAEATVRREGVARRIPANELVPGDVVVLDAGDVLTADVRVVTASRLQLDESALTGESLPVGKNAECISAGAALSERSCMLYKGTSVARGAGEGIVVATGMRTELGQISSLVATAETAATPLEQRLDRLARRLIGLTVVITALVAIALLAAGEGLYFAVEVAITLAVATIPEGLPIVATVALARGMWRMAHRNALVEQLAAVETLGSTTLILTDKTGTLTENRMTLVELQLAEGRVEVEGSGLGLDGEFRYEGRKVSPSDLTALIEALRIGVLCNNATLGWDESAAVHATGDPTEVALLVAGAKAGLARSALLDEWPEEAEVAFDPGSKQMATLHRRRGAMVACVKGAPEAIVEHCAFIRRADGSESMDASAREHWLGIATQMAARGERVLALATREVSGADAFGFQDLTLVALVGLFDPPRASVREAVNACQDAGIRVVMVTGDHGATAWNVASAVGLIDPVEGEPPSFVDARSLPDPLALSDAERERLRASAIIARATPRQKLDLIELHQRGGEIVAMTGDGVNDAPALKKADIGIAMGIRGTQVAREAADMVLQNDELRTIVTAVALGRGIFANIRKFVVYLMSCNVSEIIAVGLAAMVQAPLPILPLQILFLNLVTDVFPALALGVCEGSPALMREPPRDPAESVLTRAHWQQIFGLGSVIAISVLGALFAAHGWLGLPERTATTVSFITLALAQLWHVFTMRNRGSRWIRNEVVANPWVWTAILLCLALIALAVHWSPLAGVLGTRSPGLAGWGLAIAASLVPFAVGQLSLLHEDRSRPHPERDVGGKAPST